MAQTVLITLTVAGADTGPFDLFSDVDGYIVPFETGVSKAALVAGYTSVLVPDLTTVIRVKSQNVLCGNYVDLPITGLTTTTTTTTETPTTTTTTSTETPTTTTTTTTEPPPTTTTTTTNYCQSIGAGAGCFNWNFTAGAEGAVVEWTNCSGAPSSTVLGPDESGSACLCDGQTPSVSSGSLTILSQVGQC